ncbi:hypothetical protein D3C72_1746420 [compost metagenome]
MKFATVLMSLVFAGVIAQANEGGAAAAPAGTEVKAEGTATEAVAAPKKAKKEHGKKHHHDKKEDKKEEAAK